MIIIIVTHKTVMHNYFADLLGSVPTVSRVSSPPILYIESILQST